MKSPDSWISGQFSETWITNSAFTYLGYVTAAYAVYRIVSAGILYTRPSKLNKYLQPPTTIVNNSTKAQRVASWALVTGASDGIGFCLAEELAASGFNVLLHGRNSKKVDGVKEELSVKYPQRKFHTLIIDAVGGDGLQSRIDKALKQLEDYCQESQRNGVIVRLNVLVNNVGGFGGLTSVWASLSKRTPDDVNKIFDMNARFPTLITIALLPLLQQNSPSLIINIGSAGAEVPSAFNSIYASCKAYVHALSRSLTAEMLATRTDIEVLAVVVGVVATANAGEAAKPGLFVPTPSNMAKAILARVGCGRSIVMGSWAHALQTSMVYWMPEWLFLRTYLNIVTPMMEIEARDISLRAKEDDGTNG